MPGTCADLDVLFGQERPRKSLAAKTYGYVEDLCARIRSPHERKQLTHDLMHELYLKLKSTCASGEIRDLDAVVYVSIRRDIGNHCKRATSFSAFDDTVAERQSAVIPAMSHEQFDRMVELARSWVEGDRDKMLFDMHVEGRSNPEMCEAGQVSDRTVSRLRAEFNGLLLKAWKQLYS